MGERDAAMSDDVKPEATGQQGTKDADARKFKRFPCRLRLRCRRFKGAALSTSDEQYVEGVVRNRSEGGFLLETPIYFPEEGKLEIAFHSPDRQQAFAGVVTVKWTKRVGDCFHLGCSTDELQQV